jgi:hypothetical protein
MIDQPGFPRWFDLVADDDSIKGVLLVSGCTWLTLRSKALPPRTVMVNDLLTGAS